MISARMRIKLAQDWKAGLPSIRLPWPRNWSRAMVTAAHKSTDFAVLYTVGEFLDDGHLDMRRTDSGPPGFYRHDERVVDVDTELPDGAWTFTLTGGSGSCLASGFEDWARMSAGGQHGVILVPVRLAVLDERATLECNGSHR